MLSKSANPSLATPSQAPRGEGVETGWEPPDRVTAKVKAQSRPRTLSRSSGGESRSGMGSGESWFDPRRGNSKPDVARCAVGLAFPDRGRPRLTRRFAVGRTPEFEPRPPAWAIELHHSTHRLVIGVLVSEQGARIPPTAGRRDVLEREVLSLRCPSASEHEPKSSLG